jgi:hypothetical protein
MWFLIDYKTIQTRGNTPYLSTRSQEGFDCAEERGQSIVMVWFSGNMLTGDIVLSVHDEGKWEPVQPGSINEGLWKYACGKQ